MPGQLLILGNPERKRRMAAARQRAAKLTRRLGRNPASLVVFGGNPRRNGRAEELYEDFQGREPGSLGEPPLLEYDETQDMPRKAVVLGDLVALGFSNVSKESGEEMHGEKLASLWKDTYSHLSFASTDVKLAANSGRTQLYFVGGDQELSPKVFEYLGVSKSGDRTKLGPVFFIVYDTRKSQDSFEGGTYCHEFGEDGGRRPTAYYDARAERVLLRGGSYVIEDRGIVN